MLGFNPTLIKCKTTIFAAVLIGMASEIHKDHLKRFGTHLASLRKARNLSYRKLALVCDIDFADIKKYENGEINLTFSSLIELSKGLAISLKELMDFE